MRKKLLRTHICAGVFSAVILPTCLSLALTRPVFAQNEPAYRIVVHPDNPITTLTKKDLKNIFLKRVVKWPDGEPIIPVDLSPDSSVRDAFSRDIHKRSPDCVNACWQRKLFSGRGVPPCTFPEESAILEFVRNHVGAIGYVSAVGDANGVKTLKVIP